MSPTRSAPRESTCQCLLPLSRDGACLVASNIKLSSTPPTTVMITPTIIPGSYFIGMLAKRLSAAS